MRVAVCLWGLQRSTQYTYVSIKKHVFEPLLRRNFEVDIFLHTFTIRSYVNERAKEHKKPSPNLWKYFKPKAFLVEDQDRVDPLLHLTDFRNFGCPWNSSNFHTLDNLIRSLYSLKKTTELMEGSGVVYDFVVFCRPDLLFQNSLSPSHFTSLDDSSIALVDYAKFPVNDRFAVCRPRVARLFGYRFDHARSYSRSKPLHAESFLNDILVQNNIGIHEIHVVFSRVRSNGLDKKDNRGKGGI